MIPRQSNRKPSILIIVIIIIMIASGINITSFSACGENSVAISTFHINANFILWQPHEKMLDNNFTISLYYLNETNNDTAYYEIQIDENFYFGLIFQHEIIFINISRSLISVFNIKIDNITLLEVYDIAIEDNINADSVRRGYSPYTINLSPREWTSREYNLIFASIIASFIMLPIAYRIVKHYKKYRGVVEV